MTDKPGEVYIVRDRSSGKLLWIGASLVTGEPRDEIERFLTVRH